MRIEDSTRQRRRIWQGGADNSNRYCSRGVPCLVSTCTNDSTGGWSGERRVGTSVTCITASWKPVSAPINFSPLIYTPATPSISELGETGATPASCFSFYLPLSPFLVLSRNSRFRSKIYKDSGHIKIDTDRFDRN